jgi:hypothetical protein
VDAGAGAGAGEGLPVTAGAGAGEGVPVAAGAGAGDDEAEVTGTAVATMVLGARGTTAGSALSAGDQLGLSLSFSARYVEHREVWTNP